MPHIIVKLVKGKTEEQKRILAEALTTAGMSAIGFEENSFSVAIEDIELKDWAEKVYQPEIMERIDKLYKQPGYKM